MVTRRKRNSAHQKIHRGSQRNSPVKHANRPPATTPAPPLSASLLPLLIRSATVLTAFWVALFAAWMTLSAVNFAYPILYDVVGIEQTIRDNGPKNRYKPHFEQTSRDERIRLFAQLSQAINHNGEGLEKIRYHDAQGNVIGTFLRAPEIVHLNDVSQLISLLRSVGYAALTLLLLLIAWMKFSAIPPLRISQVIYSTLATALLITLFVVGYGAEKIFYQGHLLIFPEGHQWFFYYYESLMTMLMKAPDIFAYIAALLLLLALVFFSMALWLINRLLRTTVHTTEGGGQS
ncbi:MAG: DUF1461 domain-containing protein [Gammaproteobacteria bacterium]|nr:DUF1461 domain-containing protein [Gammaproteobacteria bacterium]